MRPWPRSALMALTRFTRSCASSRSGTPPSPIAPPCPSTWLRMLPLMRFLPRPRSMSKRWVSASSRLSCGVRVPRTSSTVAKALTIRLTGEVTFWALPEASCHCVRIDSESLPTGMEIPSCGHSSMPTACTVRYSAASSPGSPQAAIQLAESLTRESSMGAASRLVMASATAMRPDAGASSTASGVRSPMLMASPAMPA